jgi:hypothetical protein
MFYIARSDSVRVSGLYAATEQSVAVACLELLCASLCVVSALFLDDFDVLLHVREPIICTTKA